MVLPYFSEEVFDRLLFPRSFVCHMLALAGMFAGISIQFWVLIIFRPMACPTTPGSVPTALTGPFHREGR